MQQTHADSSDQARAQDVEPGQVQELGRGLSSDALGFRKFTRMGQNTGYVTWNRPENWEPLKVDKIFPELIPYK